MKQALLLAILGIAFVPAISATDRPPLPPGFSWQEIPAIHAIFLKPDGWFFHQEMDNGTLAYFISKEDISKGGEFQTGLTINVFPKLKQGSAIDRGRAFVDNLVAKHPGSNHWDRRVGPFQQYGCNVTDTDQSGTTVMSTYVLANPKTNTLYLLIFESPQSTWDTYAPIEKQIMSTMSLDDSF
ncbi:MAG: hypothetical protein ABSF57_08960 [Acidobacteriaceae bacterium]|jgi:hypothetical protein